MKIALPIALLCVGLIIVAGPASANEGPTCGQVVTENLTLTASLTGCETGLVVGADGIMIDLNGFVIEGVGADGSVGIDALGRTGVTIKNGGIRGFTNGVHFFETTSSTISGLRVSDTTIGISLSGIPPHDPGTDVVVERNVVTDSLG